MKKYNLTFNETQYNLIVHALEYLEDMFVMRMEEAPADSPNRSEAEALLNLTEETIEVCKNANECDSSSS